MSFMTRRQVQHTGIRDNGVPLPEDTPTCAHRVCAPPPSDSSAHEEALCKRQQRSLMYAVRMAYTDRITIEPGRRGGKPCIRGLRITVYDVEAADMRACLQFAADRERRLVSIPLE